MADVAAVGAAQTTSTPSTVLLSHPIASFEPEKESFESFSQRFKAFVLINNFSDDQTRASLIRLLSPEVFEQLYDYVRPADPLDIEYKELMEKLEEMFQHTILLDAERYRFFTYPQKNLSHSDFYKKLKNISRNCEFEAYKTAAGKSFLEEALRLSFTMGLSDSALRQQLLGKIGLSMSDALAHAQRRETVRAGEKSRKGGGNRVEEETDISAVHRQTAGRSYKRAPAHRGRSMANAHQQRTTPTQSDGSKCPGCNSTQHTRSACPFREAVCHKCNRVGHIKRACRSKSQVYTVDQEVAGVYQISKSKLPPFTVNVKLNGHLEAVMLDTGAALSIINKQTWVKMGKPKLKSSTSSCRSYTGRPLVFSGHTEIAVTLEGKTLNLPVHVTPSGLNLMGRDWVRAFTLDKKPLNAIATTKSQVGEVNSVQEIDSDVEAILARYPEAFASGLGHCTKKKARLVLEENARPPFIKARPVPYAVLPAVEKELERWLSLGIISPIRHSDFAAPLVIVRKPNGSLRLCADFSTGLNAALKIDQYPLPQPSDLFTKLNGGKYFSKIDLTEAYLQIKVDDDSKKYLVINTPKGLFIMNRLPFGIASAPAIFQETMEDMLRGIENVVVYLDDTLIVTKTKKAHLHTLEKVMQRICEYGFRIKPEKCSFLKESIEYLGFVVDEQGRHASTKKIEAIVNMPAPENISKLRSLLGMINHYAQFLPRLSDHLAPMNKLLQKDVAWNWSEACQNAFDQIKSLLKSPLLLTHYDPGLPVILAADASPEGIGAVISHKMPDGSEKVIAHASKTLTATQQRYSQIEKESLALVFGVKKFHQYLAGRHFMLLTDHKPLVTVYGSKKGIPPTTANRLQRWAIWLMGYSFDIQYRSTKCFGQADGLSRLPAGPDNDFDIEEGLVEQQILQVIEDNQQQLPVTAADVARETEQEALLSKVLKHANSGWDEKCPDTALKPYFYKRTELTVANRCIIWGVRTVIPQNLRAAVFDTLHVAHPGGFRMKSLARMYCFWPKIDKDIEEHSRHCEACSLAQKEPVKSIQPWPTPERAWQRLHLDYAGPFLRRMFLIVVDAKSKWPEVVMLRKATTHTTILSLERVFSRHGLPECIVSDNGTQFTSHEFKDFCESHGIAHLFSPPFHPPSNGLAERFVDTFKRAIKKAKEDEGSLERHLLQFLTRYRATPHATTGISPAESLHGRPFRTELDLLKPPRHEPPISTVSNKRLREFAIGSRVLARHYVGGKKRWEAGIVIARTGAVTYDVKVQHADRVWSRHADQLRPRSWSSPIDDSRMPTLNFGGGSVKPPNNGRKIKTDNRTNVKLTADKPKLTVYTRQVIPPEAEAVLPPVPQPVIQLPDSPEPLRRSTRTVKPTKRLIDTMDASKKTYD